MEQMVMKWLNGRPKPGIWLTYPWVTVDVHFNLTWPIKNLGGKRHAERFPGTLKTLLCVLLILKFGPVHLSYWGSCEWTWAVCWVRVSPTAPMYLFNKPLYRTPVRGWSIGSSSKRRVLWPKKFGKCRKLYSPILKMAQYMFLPLPR